MLNIDINPEVNFWVLNPQAKLIFAKLYEEDESEDQEESSKYLWALTFMYHPKSILNEFLYSEKLRYVQENYMNDSNWDPDDGKGTEALYINSVLTAKQRVLEIWRGKFDERNLFMDSLSYFDGDGDTIEKMMEKTTKMWDGFMKAEKDVIEEREESTLGGAVESAAEQGKI